MTKQVLAESKKARPLVTTADGMASRMREWGESWNVLPGPMAGLAGYSAGGSGLATGV